MAGGIRIRVSDFGAAFSAELVLQSRQFQYATVIALTRTAKRTIPDVYDEMRRVFDRPTPFTMRSLFFKPATLAKPEAGVETRLGFNSVPAGRYLNPEVYGGARRMKSSERKLGTYLIPSRYAELDQYGNLPGATYRKVLSNLRVDEAASSGSKSSKSARAKEAYFRRGDIIFRRTRQIVDDKVLYAISPVLIAIKSPSYQRRLDLIGVCERAFDRYYSEEFNRALTEPKRSR